ncbi:nucleotidyltransferase domain-containing protein [Pseudomonas sp. A-1]|uniref:nucleotidyltransferase domain-containing protein n=1 Tax=Pseudomonas sp. A-1 TaxID=1821274 RepID=UPI001C4990B5|nr:nucleotidyltransferase domain-containing protein [Pseudomonas sp. A-1]
MSFLITATDLPGANLVANVRLLAGRGWLSLVRAALADLSDLKIMAVREDAGALVIDTTSGSDAQRMRLAEIREASLHVCELCGLPGELVFEGLMDGRPAGWHRTRCPVHRDWRTCPPFPLGQARGLLDRETEAAARRFLSLIADRYDIAGALLYGSRARGTHRPDSDADLAVILPGEHQHFLSAKLAMADVAFDVLLETGILISPLPIWLDEWKHPENYSNPALLHTIAAEGIPVQTEQGNGGTP